FLWHAYLLHGGAPVIDPKRTRRSLICHYWVESDCRRAGAHLVPAGGGYWLQRPAQAIPGESAVSAGAAKKSADLVRPAKRAARHLMKRVLTAARSATRRAS